MKPINTLGFETKRGFRTMDLLQGDITAMESPVDVLVVSAFANGYTPLPGTVLGALSRQLQINLRHYSERPALDLRAALGTWVSEPIRETPQFGRIVCVEIVGKAVSIEEALENVFATLLVLEAKGIPIATVAMPLLGTGAQALDAEPVAKALIHHAQHFMDRSGSTSRLMFVEIDGGKATAIAEAMDRILGRIRVSLPHARLAEALRQDVLDRWQQARNLFPIEADALHNEWVRLLQQPEVRAAEMGVLSRKLVELILTQRGQSHQSLAKRIRAFEETGEVAPWICGYMHVLRHLGNEAAHDNAYSSTRRPTAIAPEDLVAGLFCVRRLLEFWIDYPHPSVVGSS